MSQVVQKVYHVRAAFRDERGQIVVLTVVMLVALMGITALSIDASFMYAKRNRFSAAADAAAQTAMIELVRVATSTDTAGITAFATKEVEAQLGSSAGVNVSVGCYTAMSTSGALSGSVGCGATTNYVQVTISQTLNTFFGRFYNWANATPTASAVAGTTQSADCLIALGANGGTATN